MIDIAVQNALMTQISNAGLSVPISSPLVPFTPVVGVSYVDVHPVMRSQPQSIGIDLGGDVLRRGIFQVDAVVPDGQGEQPGLTLASAIAAAFEIGTRLAAESYVLKINSKPYIKGPIKDSAYVRYPVTIPYTLVTSN